MKIEKSKFFSKLRLKWKITNSRSKEWKMEASVPLLPGYIFLYSQHATGQSVRSAPLKSRWCYKQGSRNSSGWFLYYSLHCVVPGRALVVGSWALSLFWSNKVERINLIKALIELLKTDYFDSLYFIKYDILYSLERLSIENCLGQVYSRIRFWTNGFV